MAPPERRNDANCSFLESIISDMFSMCNLEDHVPLQVRWAAQRVRPRHRQPRKVHCLEEWQKHSTWRNVVIIAVIALCKESRRIQRGEGYLAAPMARHGAS